MFFINKKGCDRDNMMLKLGVLIIILGVAFMYSHYFHPFILSPELIQVINVVSIIVYIIIGIIFLLVFGLLIFAFSLPDEKSIPVNQGNPNNVANDYQI